MPAVHDRTTKYIIEARLFMSRLGHATNSELHEELQYKFPDISLTTVHRITARMVEHGELQMAPNSIENSMRFDANILPHDHFACERCGLLRDANLGDIIHSEIDKVIGDECSVSESLTVSGVCKRCHNANK